jgi:hypothetical protein
MSRRAPRCPQMLLPEGGEDGVGSEYWHTIGLPSGFVHLPSVRIKGHWTAGASAMRQSRSSVSSTFSFWE